MLPTLAGGHAARALRLKPGDRVLLFNGSGLDHAAELLRIDKRDVTARVLDEGVPALSESPLRLTLAQGIARGEKMDLILQKATELGVARIVPLFTARTEVRLIGERAERRLAHWRAVIVSACEQCGRGVLPTLAEPQDLASWVVSLDVAVPSAGAGAERQDNLRLILDPHGSSTVRGLTAFGSATLAIGPEGGLSDADRSILQRAGFRGLRLGPRILRTETAGLAAIAALQALHGDL